MEQIEEIAARPSNEARALARIDHENVVRVHTYGTDDDVTCMKTLKDDGAKIVSLSEAERAQFVAAVADVVAVEKERFDPELLAMFDAA